ncbi:MAG: type II secretion system protein GspE [Phycisphaeraceae bacterium]|nr:type II secretion system protein GspE [Phycisphaeraceae bacterium]
MKFNISHINNPILDIQQRVIEKLRPSVAIRYGVMPIAENEGELQLACSDLIDWNVWDELEHILDCKLLKVHAAQETITQMHKMYYGLGAETVERLTNNNDLSENEQLQVTSAKATNLTDDESANEPTVVNLVNRIISEAITSNATDIHFEPFDSKYRVRYRVDGMLEDVSIPQSVKKLKSALVSRIKIMANLDITEKRLPQDGRARVTLKGVEYDLRISILPGVYGEAINIRLQSRQMVKLELSGLGFQPDEQSKVDELINRPHGLVLVTGPTGSGKTTTLYTCLSKINKPDTKIITIEDPVEYWMDDILQMQVHEEIGFDFARALRSMLRHDPDVMLIGEIRDRETADITIRSALTGHLVFATLHTNDSASAVSRLLDIGIEPFLAASSISGVIAQRLVRKICPNCKQPVEADELNDVSESWTGKGCEACRYTGCKGRSVIAEILPVSSAVRTMIQQREPADRIKEQAVQEGMNTLRNSALQAVKEGRISMAEMLRVTHGDI